ncbi:MAG TPA: hypothetical protein VH723_03410 [Candidatus Limnocylindrales bacterium]|jgi:hypothetical protein
MNVAVHTFPSVDDDFRSTTQRAVAESWKAIHESERLLNAADRLIEEVQSRLRNRYPEAVVRLKDAQAELGTPETQTIYAFRDGRAA